MRVILFGATGMVGQGVLRECLLDPDVNAILTVGRSATGTTDAKVRELVPPNMFNYSGVERELAGYDACFFCLGVSSAGMKEPDYERVTYGLTMAAAQSLVRMNPQMTFVYVSGQGTDSSEKGRTMWARVKGKTENALLRLPFKSAYMFRPGFIQPLHGIRSKTALYQAIYSLTGPVIPLLRWLFPKVILTTEEIGKVMLAVAKRGSPVKVLEVRDMQALLPVG